MTNQPNRSEAARIEARVQAAKQAEIARIKRELAEAQARQEAQRLRNELEGLEIAKFFNR
ncbi:MAG: hypothetical protein AAGI22_18370 [Planctomycetota bacterium]